MQQRRKHSGTWRHLALVGLLPASLASRLFTADRHARDVTADWNYVDHGASWSTMGQCGALSSQSPINTSLLVPAGDDGLQLFYRFQNHEAPVEMKNDGRSLIASLPRNIGKVAVGPNYLQATYEAEIIGITVHVPSEHTFNGAKTDLELQVWLRQGKEGHGGKLVAVAIGFEKTHNGTSEMLFALQDGGLPHIADTVKTVNVADNTHLDFDEIFGPRETGGVKTVGVAEAEFWQYSGSLTAPPCTNDVVWFVRSGQPLPASEQEIYAFRDAIQAVSLLAQNDTHNEGNTRSLQDAGGRYGILRPAHDAIQMPAPMVNETFDKHLLETDASQEKFGEELTSMGDPPSSDMGDTSAMSTNTKSPSIVCSEDLAQSKDELAMAQQRKSTNCGQAADGKDTVATSGVGTERLTAANNLHAVQALCAQETSTVAALANDVSAQEARCTDLNADAEASAEPADTTEDTTSASASEGGSNQSADNSTSTGLLQKSDSSTRRLRVRHNTL